MADNTSIGLTFTETIKIVKSVAVEPTIDLGQRPYFLTEYDFSLIKRITITEQVAISLFSGGLIFLCFLGVKFLLNESGQSVEIEKWEWIGTCVVIGISPLLFLLGHFFRVLSNRTR